MNNFDISKFFVNDGGTYVTLPSQNLLDREVKLCNFSIKVIGKILQHHSDGTITENL